MTLNYRAGLFRIWLVLSIVWVATAAWGQPPIEVVAGVPAAFGLALYAIIWAVRGFGVNRRPPAGFFDLNELRLDLASVQTQSPDTYKNDVAPLLDLMQARYGNHVPRSEMERVQQVLKAHQERIARQKKEVIDRAAAEGKTIEISALRQNLEKNKAEYQGKDRDIFCREQDRFLAELTAKYGERIPVNEAQAILEKLEANVTASPCDDDDSALEWTAEPGFQERRLLTRHNNVFFPSGRRKVTRQQLSWAKQTDAEMFARFQEAAEMTIRALMELKGKTVSVAEGTGLFKELNELIEHGNAIGSRTDSLVGVLRAGCGALVQTIEDCVPDENTRSQMKDARIIIERLNRLTQHQAYIDVSKAERAETLPTLLSCSVQDLRFLFQDQPPELAEFSNAWQNNKEELRSFATQLSHESTEAKAKLLQEPEKLEFLKVTFSGTGT